ncbi:MAG: serine/threonine-protein kinase [Myxococcota bacterium]
MGDSSPSDLVAQDISQTGDLEPTVHGTPAPDPQSVPRIARGDSVGRYVVLDLVGHGGMGRVYKSYDPKLKREVALKLLRTTASEMEVRAFREAQAMAALAHPNVVPVYDVDRADGRIYIAMEFIAGQTMRAWLKKRPLEPGPNWWREVLGLMVQAGRGIAAAHAAGLVHRDLKPSNIVIGDDGRVRVMDFGLARGSGVETETGDFSSSDSIDTTGPLTQLGTVLGTPPYMPPEQHRAGTIDERSDQFAFCVVFFEALFGRRPFVADKLEALARLKEQGLRTWPTSPAMPAWLAKAIRKGLAPRRAGRFSTMDALLKAIDRDATPRSRRLPYVAGAVVAAGAMGAGWAVSGGVRNDDPCAATRSAAEELWTPSVRDRLRDRLRSAPLPFAADTAERTTTRLEAYATEWAEARYDACAATQVRHEQSEALMDRRFACLDRAGAALASTVEELSTPGDTTVARNAVRAVLGLPALARCSDQDQLLAALGRPDDPSVAAEVAAIEERLEEAEVKRRAGHHELALADARELLVSAERVDYGPIRAEVLYLLGRLLEKGGDYEEARETLQRAYHAAIAAGHDDVAANAAAELTFVVGGLMQDHKRAGVYAEDSRAWADKLDTDDARARHENIYATLLQQMGRYKEAQRRFERVLEIRERTNGPDSLRVANALNNLANVLMDQGDPEKATPLYGRAVGIGERVFGPDHVNVGAYLNNLANSKGQQGQYDDAWPLYQRALSIFERTYGREHPDVAGFIVNMAGVARARGRTDESFALFSEALKLERKLLPAEHPRIAATLSNVGTVHTDRGEYEDAAPLFEEALSINETAFGESHPSVAASLERMAAIDSHRGDDAAAQVRLERAVAIHRTTESTPLQRANGEFLLAQTLWRLGDDRPRARSLAEVALDRTRGRVGGDDLTADIETWLETRVNAGEAAPAASK